jgi:hypothetical protein
MGSGLSGHAWTQFLVSDILIAAHEWTLVAIAVITVLIGIFVLFDRGVFSTRYALGYSEHGFDRTKMGDGREVVRQVLGEPLKKSTNDPSFVVWINTQRSPGGGNWKYRQIAFSNDVVIQKFSALLD